MDSAFMGSPALRASGLGPPPCDLCFYAPHVNFWIKPWLFLAVIQFSVPKIVLVLVLVYAFFVLVPAHENNSASVDVVSMSRKRRDKDAVHCGIDVEVTLQKQDVNYIGLIGSLIINISLVWVNY